MEEENFWNRKVGGFSLALLFIIGYIGFKSARAEFNTNFYWYCTWFVVIIINALVSDLFESTDSWIFNSLKAIEEQKITPEEKIKQIRIQLEIAVNKYSSVFFMVNKSKIFSRIVHGKITTKEVIIIFLYAMYDLVLRDANLSIIAPYDIALMFGVMIILRIVDASKGFTSLVANMYDEVFKERDPNITLDIIRDYITQLCNFYNKEAIKIESKEVKK